MDKDQLDDLKQFIATTVSQSEARLRTELRKEWKSDLQAGLAGLKSELRIEWRSDLARETSALRQEMREGFAAVAETLDEIHAYLHRRDAEIDRRLTRLEQHLI